MTKEQLLEIKTIYEELKDESLAKKDFNLAFKFKDEIRFIERYINEKKI